MVPKGWQVQSFSELDITLVDGDRGKNYPKKEEYLENGYCLFLGADNITNGELDLKRKIFISKERYDSLGKGVVTFDDILLVMRGNGTGRIGLYSETVSPYPIARINSGLIIIRLNHRTLEKNFMIQLMRSSVIIKQFESYMFGSAQPQLTVQILKSILLPIPPYFEQVKIAKILSVWDKAITTTEQLLANSQQQKKALMQKLLTGKVRFLKNNANKFEVRKGYSKSRLGSLPSDWSVETIKKHLWFQEGPGVRNFQFTESGVKLFNGTNIQFNNISLSKTTTHISEEEAFGAYKHFLVDAGDLLIACSGISVDRFDEKIAFVGEEHLPLCMNTSTMRFKTIDSNVVDIRYFQYFMQSNLFKNQIRRQATGSAQLNFGPSHVAKCFVVLPSFQEQKKIASLLSLVDGEIRAIQKKLNLLNDEKAALMQQLLTGKRRVAVNV